MMLLTFFLITTTASSDTNTMTGQLNTKFWLRVPSLSSISLGYGNPVLASGLIGGLCNPAGLFDIKDREFMIAGGIGTTATLNWAPAFPIKKSDQDTSFFKVPLDISFNTPAGINFIGIGIKTKIFGAIGIGFTDGLGFGTSINSTSRLTYTFDDTIPDTLTNTEIPQLPAGQGIPVSWAYKSPVTTTVNIDADASYSERNFFLCIANGIGPIRVGAGIAYKPIIGHADMTSNVNANAPCSLQCIPDIATTWKTNVIGHTTINQDLGSLTTKIYFKGSEFSFPLGLQFKLGFLNLGTSVVFTPATTLRMDTRSIELVHVNHSPHVDSLYYNSSDIQIDSANDSISGKVNLVFSEMPDTTKTYDLNETYIIPSQTAVLIGGALKLGPFSPGISIGFSSAKSIWTNFGFESRLLISWRVNLGIRYDNHILNGTEDSTEIYIPTATLDLGASFPIQKATINLGLRTNPLTLAGAFGAALPGDANKEDFKMPGLLDAFSPIIGVNLKF